MSGLWWLQPGWGDACCAQCGQNIKATGGDPDWGLCWPCKSAEVNARHSRPRLERQPEQQQTDTGTSAASPAVE